MAQPARIGAGQNRSVLSRLAAPTLAPRSLLLPPRQTAEPRWPASRARFQNGLRLIGIQVRTEGRFFGAAIRATPSRRDIGEYRSGWDALLGQAFGFLINEIAAPAHEAAVAVGGCRNRDFDAAVDARNLDAVAGRDGAAFPGDEVYAEVLVAERCAQRARDVEVATAGVGIDVGGATASVAPLNPERRLAHAQIAADPLELLPGPGTVAVETGPEAQWIDFEA